MKLRRVAFSVCILVRLGEKKRYPTVSEFNPDDESHTNFILSATCLFAVMIGLIPPKKEDDDDWLKDYRFVSTVGTPTNTLLELCRLYFQIQGFYREHNIGSDGSSLCSCASQCGRNDRGSIQRCAVIIIYFVFLLSVALITIIYISMLAAIQDETGPKQIAKNELEDTLASLFSDLRATVDIYQQRSAATGKNP